MSCKAYKLFKVRRDGTLGSLFINCRQRIPIGQWLEAETHHHRKGYAYRPGWHFTFEPKAPHLSNKGRVWCEIEVKHFVRYNRPVSQGGVWGLAKFMKIKRLIE